MATEKIESKKSPKTLKSICIDKIIASLINKDEIVHYDGEERKLIERVKKLPLPPTLIKDICIEIILTNISKYKYISEKFIDENHERINWRELSMNRNLTLKMIEKYEDKWNWVEIYLHHCWNGDDKGILEKYKNKFNFQEIYDAIGAEEYYEFYFQNQ